MWLVGSKPIRSNVTIATTGCHRVLPVGCCDFWAPCVPTKSFSRVFVHKWRHVSYIMMSSIMTSLSILNIWWCGGLTALNNTCNTILFCLAEDYFKVWSSFPCNGVWIKRNRIMQQLSPATICFVFLFLWLTIRGSLHKPGKTFIPEWVFF